jgi:hypothetical protein
MNCKRAKLHIALLIGDDLDEDAQAELREHLRECAPCREYHAGMADAPQFLHDIGGPVLQSHDSLWPDLLDKLPPRPGLRLHEFHGWWAAAVAVVVAFLAIGLFWNDEARSGRWNAPVATQRHAVDSPAFAELPKVPPIGVGDQPRKSRPPQRFSYGSYWRLIPFPGDRESRRILVAPPLRGAGPSDYDGKVHFGRFDESQHP